MVLGAQLSGAVMPLVECKVIWVAVVSGGLEDPLLRSNLWGLQEPEQESRGSSPSTAWVLELQRGWTLHLKLPRVSDGGRAGVT